MMCVSFLISQPYWQISLLVFCCWETSAWYHLWGSVGKDERHCIADMHIQTEPCYPEYRAAHAYVLILTPLLFQPRHLYFSHLPAFGVGIAE